VAEHVLSGVQMVAENVLAPDEGVAYLDLGDQDAPEMVALVALTKPGPFEARTHVFGGYVGIRHEGKLVAMAGQRLQVPGYTEVSAVCTHPDFRGRGYGSFLLLTVAQRIKARGETPFLHTFASNTGAIRLYERLASFTAPISRSRCWAARRR
jgi:predicted GNAT family acetyltransferase